MATDVKPLGRDAAKKLDDIIMDGSDILHEVKNATKGQAITKEDLLIMANRVALLATDIILTAKNIKTE